MNVDLHERVMGRIHDMFDRSIIQNDLRGMYAEMLVAELLGKEWRATGEAWSGWDLEHSDGCRLEVKQSAARQNWAPSESGPSAPRFSIKAAKGVWADGIGFTESLGRLAHNYVFAWHGDASSCADHRDADQWVFFVVPSPELPDQKTIGLESLRKIASEADADTLRHVVERIRQGETIQ